MFRSLVIVFLVITTAEAYTYSQQETCRVYGDPHVQTYDGSKYDLVGLEGEFLITKSSGDFPYNSIEVKGVATKTNLGLLRPKASRLTSVYVTAKWDGANATKSTYLINGTGVYKDGKSYKDFNIGYTDIVVLPMSSVMTVKFKLGKRRYPFWLRYDPNKHALTLGVDFDDYASLGGRGKMKGACGNMDGNKDDDLSVISAMGLNVKKA